MGKSRRLVLDVDAVVSDLSGHTIDILKLPLKREEQTKREFEELLEPKYKKLIHDLFDTAEFWGTLPLVEDAQEGVDYVRRKGWSIIWATSPWHGCREWGHMRYHWLNEHFDVKPEHVMIGASKETIAGAVFIDDRLENVDAWQAEHPDGLALIFDTPYTKKVRTYQRFSWKDAAKVFG